MNQQERLILELLAAVLDKMRWIPGVCLYESDEALLERAEEALKLPPPEPPK